MIKRESYQDRCEKILDKLKDDKQNSRSHSSLNLENAVCRKTDKGNKIVIFTLRGMIKYWKTQNIEVIEGFAQ